MVGLLHVLLVRSWTTAARALSTQTDGSWKPKKLPAVAPTVQGLEIDCVIVAHLNNVQHVLYFLQIFGLQQAGEHVGLR